MKTLTKVVGTSYGRRQRYLAYLATCDKDDIKIILRREPNNKYDPNAIRIAAHNKKTGKYADCGYVPANKAAVIAPLMDGGRFAIVTGWEINAFNGNRGMKCTICY